MFVQTPMASEIKVGMLSAQGCTDGVSPFKIITARPQSPNLILFLIEDSYCHNLTFII